MNTQAQHKPLYRIGAVSKATGVPVPTLRIWERRYHALSPTKTDGNQRLYSDYDVSKAHVLKQLTAAGHAIGAVASLSLEALRHLGASHPPISQSGQPHHTAPLLIAVVDVGLANRIESQKFASVLQRDALQVAAVYNDIEHALHTPWTEDAKVCVIKVTSLQRGMLEAIQQLNAQRTFVHTVVLYNFAPDMLVQAMRAAGLTVRRDPISDIELAELLQSVLMLQPLMQAHTGVTASAGPRKYNDQVLKRVANIPTSVLCECPKHVAELITQLANFETYTQDCLSRNDDDAHLHAYLKVISGSARALFENALEKIAEHEGIDLCDNPASSITAISNPR